eukprot:3379021-Amphidinium_carterae.4
MQWILAWTEFGFGLVLLPGGSEAVRVLVLDRSDCDRLAWCLPCSLLCATVLVLFLVERDSFCLVHCCVCVTALALLRFPVATNTRSAESKPTHVDVPPTGEPSQRWVAMFAQHRSG